MTHALASSSGPAVHPLVKGMHALRLLVVPLAVTVGLVAFGQHPAQADDTIASMQFDLSWGTVTAAGAGFSAEMVGDSLHVTAGTGGVELQIDPNRIIGLSSGDEVWLSGLTDGNIKSIAVNVVNGEAQIRPVLKSQGFISDDGSSEIMLGAPLAEGQLFVIPGESFSLAIASDEGDE
jgi:hypothetical protein